MTNLHNYRNREEFENCQKLINEGYKELYWHYDESGFRFRFLSKKEIAAGKNKAILVFNEDIASEELISDQVMLGQVWGYQIKYRIDYSLSNLLETIEYDQPFDREKFSNLVRDKFVIEEPERDLRMWFGNIVCLDRVAESLAERYESGDTFERISVQDFRVVNGYGFPRLFIPKGEVGKMGVNPSYTDYKRKALNQ